MRTVTAAKRARRPTERKRLRAGPEVASRKPNPTPGVKATAETLTAKRGPLSRNTTSVRRCIPATSLATRDSHRAAVALILMSPLPVMKPVLKAPGPAQSRVLPREAFAPEQHRSWP